MIMTGRGQEHGRDREEGCRGESFSSRIVALCCWGSILLASHRLPPSSLPKSVSTAAPLPAVTKQNSFGEEGGWKLIAALLIDSLEAWIPYFAREKWQLIQPYPLSFCLPVL